MEDEEALYDLLDSTVVERRSEREYAATVARRYAQRMLEQFVRRASEDGITDLAHDLGRVFESEPGSPGEEHEIHSLIERLAEQSAA